MGCLTWYPNTVGNASICSVLVLTYIMHDFYYHHTQLRGNLVKTKLPRAI